MCAAHAVQSVDKSKAKPQPFLETSSASNPLGTVDLFWRIEKASLHDLVVPKAQVQNQYIEIQEVICRHSDNCVFGEQL